MTTIYRLPTTACRIFTILLLSFSFYTLYSMLFTPRPVLAQDSTPTATITPTTGFRGKSVERSVNNLTRSLVPQEVVSQPQEDSGFFGLIKQLLSGLGYLNPLRFFGQSETLFQSEIPSETKVTPDPQKGNQDPTDPLLQGSTGVFGVSLPREVQQPDDQNNTKEVYERGSFPQEVRPLTGQI